jgi:hypothetical protein
VAKKTAARFSGRRCGLRWFRPQRLLFGFAAVFAADLALFLAAGGAVITTALFAGITCGEHRGSGGQESEGEEGER